MSDTSNIVGKLGHKLTEPHTYNIVIMIIILVTSLSIINIYRQNNLITEIKTSNKKIIKSLDDLTYMLRLQNKNTLNEAEAVYIYHCIFSNSMNEITRMAMLSISNNHIANVNRQKQIYRNYTTSIQNLYDSDYEALDKFKCNGRKLSIIMDGIKPMQVRDRVLELMFDSTRTHLERRLDIEKYLRIQSTTFTELAKKHLR